MGAIAPVLTSVARHGLIAALTVWLLVTLAFVALRVAPGGPYDPEHSLRPEVRQTLDETYRPEAALATQYREFLLRCGRGDLGPSMRSPSRGVTEVLLRGLPATASLCASALLFALAFGVSAGILGAAWRGGAADRVIWTSSVLGLGIPGFVMAPLLVLLFSTELGWLPAAGHGSLRHLVLPAVCLGAATSATLTRVTRRVLLDVAQRPHVRAARARGATGWRLFRDYLLRHVIDAVFLRLGPSIALLLSSALAIEMLFQLPGVGHHTVRAAASRDVTLVIGAVLTAGVALTLLDRILRVGHELLVREDGHE